MVISNRALNECLKDRKIIGSREIDGNVPVGRRQHATGSVCRGTAVGGELSKAGPAKDQFDPVDLKTHANGSGRSFDPLLKLHQA
jgi:hypothetical protein